MIEMMLFSRLFLKCGQNVDKSEKQNEKRLPNFGSGVSKSGQKPLFYGIICLPLRLQQQQQHVIWE